MCNALHAAEARTLSAITALKSRIADIIEPDFGLLNELLSLEVLSRRERARVRSERTVYERNDALLDLMISEEQCVKFLTALKRTGQVHVMNYITQNGGQLLSAQCCLSYYFLSSSSYSYSYYSVIHLIK